MNILIDKFFGFISFLLTLMVFLILAGIVISLFIGSFESIKSFGMGFIASSTWNPVTKSFGALVPVIGTLATAGIALLFSLPISFGVAFFISEFSPPILRVPLTVLIELLAVVPSIIYGLWGLFIFAPTVGLDIATWLSNNIGNEAIVGQFFQGASSGISLLTAAIILCIMIIPFMVSSFKDAFELVPKILKESAYALGCTKWEVIWHVIVPYTRTQMIGGTMLGLGRALGETMAVAFVIGNAYHLTASVLQPGNTIASALANEFTEAETAIYSSALVHLGLILFLITTVILAASQFLLRRMDKNNGH